MKTAVLTDSASIIDPQVKRKFNIKTLPLPLLIEGKTYYEKYNHDRMELRNELRQSKKNFLTPGQVSVDAIQEVIDGLMEKDYTDVICVHIDNSISGLGDNLRSYAIKHSELKIHLVDSYSFGIAEGRLTELVGEMVSEGQTWNEIKSVILQIRDEMQTLIVMKSLRHISTNGYIKNGVSPVEKTFFKPKTLMSFQDKGQLEVINTYSQYSRLFREIRWRIAPAYQEMTGELQISITAIRSKKNDQIISRLIALLKRVFPVAKISLHDLPLSMMAYTGADSMVISWH